MGSIYSHMTHCSIKPQVFTCSFSAAYDQFNDFTRVGTLFSASPKITEYEEAPELFGIKITAASQGKIRRACAGVVLFKITLSSLPLCLETQLLTRFLFQINSLVDSCYFKTCLT